jgi:NAD(P)-dependent dehydrogenase (short-subunit alcohol dehydrogenase family)
MLGSGVYDVGTPDLTGRTFIVTGANNGIGFATAMELAKLKATVILACRENETGEAAQQKIIEKSGNQNVHFLKCDLGSFECIKSFVESFLKLNLPLHVLINNAAAAISPTKKLTSNGFELSFGVNHLGHFMLTLLLLDKLKETKGRIVILTSGLHRRVTNDAFNDIHFQVTKYDGFVAYARSKLANIHFGYELQRRLAGTGVNVYVVHPGIVRTKLGRNSSFFTRLMFNYVIVPLFGQPIRRAVESILYVALSEKVADKGGTYWGHCQEEKSSPDSYDAEVSKRLWEMSEKLTATAENKNTSEK